ncbi:hypothetical protein EJB05_46505, partial [Eragrostis curvula]
MAGKIKTVVVLVQENRSFDHMLGWMKSLNPEIDGVTGTELNHIDASDPSSRTIRFTSGSEYVDPDPGHSMQAIYEQVYGTPFVDAASTPITPATVTSPPMSGKPRRRSPAGMSETVMRGFRPDAVPVYRELVKEFAVCDRWFASNPASTQPNRLFVHSATSHGLYPPSTLFYRNLRQLKYFGNFHPFDLSFKRHCREGKLPNYVVVEQRYFDLQAPTPPRERRPPVARRVGGPALRQGGVRGAAVGPA